MSQITCPICHLTDMVQSVSAIVTNETHATYGSDFSNSNSYSSGGSNMGTTYHSNFTSSTTYQQSSLAQQLLPPQMPARPSPPTDWATPLTGCALFIVISFGVFFISGATFENILLVVVITFLSMWLLTPRRRNARLIAQQKYQEELQKYERLSIEYQKALNRWHAAYYCRRDGIVYIPGEGKPAYLNAFHQWLLM